MATTENKFPWGPLALLLAATFIILTGGYGLYQTEEHQLRTSREKELSAIARLKAERIWEWRGKLRDDARMMVDTSYFRESLAWIIRKGELQVIQRIKTRFHSFRNYRNYQDVLLVDLKGRICVSLSEAPQPLGPVTLEGIERAVTEMGPVLTELYLAPTDATPLLDVITPVIISATETSMAVGAVILRVDPGQVLFPLLQTWPTASETAETLLVRRDEDSVLFLNELRHRKDTALKMRIPLNAAEVPAVQAIQGVRGTILGKDYRDVDVLAAIEPVRDSDWFLISKVDTEEAFSVWRARSRLVLAMITLLLAGAVGFFAFFLQRQRSQHYKSLYKAERERLALVKHFEYLIKYANDIIILTSQDSHIIEANDRAIAAYGYSAEELAGMPMPTLVAPEQRNNHLINLRESQEEGSTIYETIHQRKDGSLFDVEVSTRFIDIDGVPFLQKIIRDITERKRAQEALEQSERKFRLLFENMTSGFALHRILVDEDGHPVDYEFVEVNPAFEQLTGLKAETLTGHRVREVLPITEPYWIEYYGRTALSGESQRIEEYSAGLEKYFDVLAYCTEPGYFAVVFTDITERKLAEKARESLLASLQEKTEEMESLLYVSSHDLRSPLVNIQGFSQRLEKATLELTRLLDQEQDPISLSIATRPLLHERIPNALKYIVASANKMDLLINGLLRISRLGRSPLSACEVDMNRLLENVLAALEHQIQAAQATVSVDDLPGCWGDGGQINQVFSNLVDNALKYGGNSKPLQIHIHGEIQGEMAVYSVKDNGPGIKTEHQDKVWGLFSRLDPSGEVPGEGLGLVVVKRIVQRHRGRVWLESSLGLGSCFFVALPKVVHLKNSSPTEYTVGTGEI